MTDVLFVVSAADHWTLQDGTRHPTGFWAEELVEPYTTFTEAGYTLPSTNDSVNSCGISSSPTRSARRYATHPQRRCPRSRQEGADCSKATD